MKRPHAHRSMPAVGAALMVLAGASVVVSALSAGAAAPTTTVTYAGTDEAVPNPERGFHKGVSVTDSTGGSTTSAAQMSSIFDDGFRLARMYVRLDSYRDRPLDAALLNELREVFDNARASGIKLIPRFTYNFGSDPDAPVDRIEQHLDQLAPVLAEHHDVIAALQAGFIGAWGEWHSSTNDLTNPTDRARVRAALLDALPEDRMVQFRYPSDLVEFSATPLDASGAWSGSDLSRTAHKNDCVLANEHDAGTYTPSSRRAELRAYAAAMTEFTVMGGETCQVSLDQQRTDCPTAVSEFEMFHWDYLNVGFYGPTIDSWRGDCFDEIEQRLGYRYRMIEATASTQLLAGDRLELRLDIANEGFGKLYNPRPLNVVLRDEATGQSYRIEHSADARTVLPLPGETRTIDLSVAVPVSVPLGTFAIHIELPDGSPSLADDVRYKIRFANDGTWNAANGTNDLQLSTAVTGVSPNPIPTPGPAPMPTGSGYWMVDDAGTVFAFGGAGAVDPVVVTPGETVVDLDATPSRKGLWILDSAGVVHTRGDAGDFGDVAGGVTGSPTTLAPTPGGDGYWVFTSTGDVSTHGTAVEHGDVTDLPLNGPIVASAATVSGEGYWLLGTDGGVFALGDAQFYGSMGGIPLNQPVNGITPDPDGVGYWLVAGDGGVFAFDAPFRGSMGGTPLNAPVTGLIHYGNGYAMVATDGGAFVFSDEPFLGSLGGQTLTRPIVAMTALEQATP